MGTKNEHRRKYLQNTIGNEVIACKNEVDASMMLAIMSCSLENKKMIARYPGVLDSLAQISKSTKNTHVKLEIANILCNLAWDVDNQTILGGNEEVLDALVMLNSEVTYDTKIYASTAIQYLSSNAQNKPLLVTYGGGRLIDNLLSVAKDVLLKKSSLAAVEALMHLVDRKTTPHLVSYPEFLPTLTTLSKKCLIGKL
jgi:hypothetical protein